jgi:hypothetical protein
VLAIADGTLWANPLDTLSGLNCYIDHADGWRSGYRHLSRHVFPYNQPFPVKQGQTIGFAGNTGLSTGPHLHLDLWNRKRQSPEAFVKVGWYAHDPAKYLGIQEEEEEMKQVVWVIKSADAADQGQYVFDGVNFSRLTGKMKAFLVEHTDTYDVKEDTWAGGEITEALAV